MVLRTLSIEGYGRFAGSGEPVLLGFAPGLNVLVGPNESGKSTVIACILDLLFAPTKRERDRYQPWATPSVHGARLRVETAEGELIELGRTFVGDGPSMTVRSLTGDANGRASTKERALRELLGRELGVSDRGVFMRTCCITQDDVLPFEGRPDRDRDLVDALEAALTGGIPGMTVSAAIAALTRHLGTLRRLPEQRKDRELEELHAERGRLEAELEAAREARARLGHLLTSADDLQREVKACDEQLMVLRRALERTRQRAALLRDLRSCEERLAEQASTLGQVDAARSAIGEAERGIRSLPPTCEAWEGHRDEIVALDQRLFASERTAGEVAHRIGEHEAEVARIGAEQDALAGETQRVEEAATSILVAELASAQHDEARAERAARWSAAHIADHEGAARHERAGELAGRLDAAQSKLDACPRRLVEDTGVAPAAIERERRVVRATREAESAEDGLRALRGSRRLCLWLTWGVVPGALLLIAALVLALSDVGPFALVLAIALLIGLAAFVSHRVAAVQRPALDARQALRSARAELASAERELAQLLAACGCDSVEALRTRADQAAELRREITDARTEWAAALGDATLEELRAEADRLASERGAAREEAARGDGEPEPLAEAGLRLTGARETGAQARARLDEFRRSRGLPEAGSVPQASAQPAGDVGMASVAARLEDLDRAQAELRTRLNQVEGRLQALATDRCATEDSSAPDREVRDRVLADTQSVSLEEALERLGRLEANRQSLHQAEAQIEALSAHRSEPALREEHRSMASRRIGIEERLTREFSGTPMTPEEEADCELRIERLVVSRDEARAAEQQARGEAAAVATAIAGTAEVRERLATVERGIETTERRIRAAEIAVQVLQEAAEAVHGDLARPVLSFAQNVFRRLTRGRYDRLSGQVGAGMSFGPCREDAPLAISPEALSRGTREQLYFAVRYAFARVLAGPERRPLMLLDDPFVNFDEERVQAALDFLVDAGSEHQVLFCTHSARIADAVGERGRRIDL